MSNICEKTFDTVLDDLKIDPLEAYDIVEDALLDIPFVQSVCEKLDDHDCAIISMIVKYGITSKNASHIIAAYMNI